MPLWFLKILQVDELNLLVIPGLLLLKSYIPWIFSLRLDDFAEAVASHLPQTTFQLTEFVALNEVKGFSKKCLNSLKLLQSPPDRPVTIGFLVLVLSVAFSLYHSTRCATGQGGRQHMCLRYSHPAACTVVDRFVFLRLYVPSFRLLRRLMAPEHIPRFLPGVAFFVLVRYSRVSTCVCWWGLGQLGVSGRFFHGKWTKLCVSINLQTFWYSPPLGVQICWFSLVCLEQIAARLKLHVRSLLVR